MKVLQISSSDSNGGAARAAYRIHHAIRTKDINSIMWVNDAETGDWTVEAPLSNLGKFLSRVRPVLGNLLAKTLNTTNPVIHSSNLLPSRLEKRLDNSGAELVHLHWVHKEMLSISDIGRIRKPVVWTLHDMWAFCGAEHYTDDFRWREGYKRENRPPGESGLDLNRWTWLRKKKHWRRTMQIVTPSRWLADCVRDSVLFGDWPVTVIPNPLDTEVWRPINKKWARELLGVPSQDAIVIFGAVEGTQDYRKGFDLLKSALQKIQGEITNLRLLVFGQLDAKDSPDFGCPVYYSGKLRDDLSLRVLYSAADALVIPSRQDNLPNTGLEALSCGTPVVAFDTCGMPDIVEHRITGYLAKAFDISDLARGIVWTIRSQVKNNISEGGGDTEASWLSINARKRAEERFSCSVVADQYLQVYQQALYS